MKLKMEAVCAQGEDYSEVMKSLTGMVNKVCEEINDNPTMAVQDIRYEQSIKQYFPQYFYVTAFIHYAV